MRKIGPLFLFLIGCTDISIPGHPGSPDGGAPLPDLGSPPTGATVPPEDRARLIAPLSTATVSSRRPLLRWVPVTGASTYTLALYHDAACTSVIETLHTTATSARPTAPLAAHSTAYWRVSATTPGGSSQSAVWELFVGSYDLSRDTSWLVQTDLNRDGRPDIAIGTGSGLAFVYLNSAAGIPASPSITLRGQDFFGGPMADAGDVNGDGYGDLIVGQGYTVGSGRGAGALIFHGGPSGPGIAPSTFLLNAEIGGAVAGAGDVNGDGYGDVLVSGPRLGTAGYLFLGGPGGVSETPTGPPMPGSPITAAGDVNGDGYADAVLCASGSATCDVYHGGPGGLTLAVRLTAPGTKGLGEAVAAAGDVNGDGYSDIVVAANETTEAYVFYGSSGGIRADNPTTLAGAPGGSFGNLHSVAAAGDVDGDGFADVIVSAYNADTVYVYQGSPGGVSTTPGTAFNMLPAGGYASSVIGPGDLNGDGFDDVAFSPGQCKGFPVLAYPGSAAGVDKTTPLLSWTNPTDNGQPVQCFGAGFSN